jgi:pectate lyase
MKMKLSCLAVAAALATCSGFALASPIGYGAGTTGGGSTTPVSVSTLAAAQAAVDAYSGSGGLVLKYTGTFDFSTITVCDQHSKAAQILEIKNKGDISIIGADGSAANFGIHIAGAAKNIIIRNMTIGLTPGGSDSDMISVEGMSSGKPSYVWIDHNTLFSSVQECAGTGDTMFDGMIDTKKGSNHITVSYNYMHDHHKVSLNGYSDSDNTDRYITWHHNRIENVGSRVPLQRFGIFHIFNNYYNNVLVSGINVRMGGQALIESNYFENSLNPVTSRDSDSIGYWDLRNNYVGSGITWSTGSSSDVNATNWTTTKTFTETLGYSYTPDAAALVKCIVTSTAGAGNGLLESTSSCSNASSSASSSAASSSSSKSSSSASSASSSSSSKASSSAASSASSSKSSSSAASSSASSASTSAPTLSGTGDYPSGFSKCADLGETCAVPSGTGWVAFGRKGNWVTKYVGVGKSVACTVAAFGSEPNGNPDKCSYQK